MQDVLKSKIEFWELFRREGVNLIYRGFELVGVYSEFIKYTSYNKSYNIEEYQNRFSEFYRKCTSIPCYKYRNIGIQIIYKHIEERKDLPGIKEHKFFISKKSMRRTGITYKNSRVRVYEGTLVMVEGILDYIKKEPILDNIYYYHIHANAIEEFLTFQKDCIDVMCGGNNSLRDKYYLKMLSDIKQLI